MSSVRSRSGGIASVDGVDAEVQILAQLAFASAASRFTLVAQIRRKFG